MKIFISWSGKKSQEVAECLESWLGQLIQAADIWISTGIEKGKPWFNELSAKLEETQVGIICLTEENLTSNWIHFEAGALSKTKDAIVCTFLLDIKPADVEPPMSHYQHTVFEKDDMRKLTHTINNRIGEVGGKAIKKENLDDLFSKLYPDLEKNLNHIKKKNFKNSARQPIRTDREILEEILSITRTLSSNSISNFSHKFRLSSLESDEDSYSSKLGKIEFTLPLESRSILSDGLLSKALNSNIFLSDDKPCYCGSGKVYKECHGKSGFIISPTNLGTLGT